MNELKTVKVRPGMHKRLKAFTEARGLRIEFIVNEALSEYLRKQKPVKLVRATE